MNATSCSIASVYGLFAKIIHLNLEVLNCDPLLYTLNHPRPIVPNQMEEFISLQRVK